MPKVRKDKQAKTKDCFLVGVRLPKSLKPILRAKSGKEDMSMAAWCENQIMPKLTFNKRQEVAS